MNIRFGHPVALCAALALGVATPLVAAGDTVVKQIDANSVLVVDYSGRPPFKRRVVALDDLSVTELARFEEVTEPVVDTSRLGEKITVVDYRGKPPFKRRVEEIDASNAAEFARFEETTEVDERPIRPRFSGKQFPARR
jgi:hypothetical protein